MPAFLRKDRLNGKEVRDEVEFQHFEAAKKIVSDLFDKIDSAFAFEEKHFENGVKSVAIKSKGNKIIYQLKEIL